MYTHQRKCDLFPRVLCTNGGMHTQLSKVYSDLRQDELILICFLRPDSVLNFLMGAIGSVLGVVGLIQLSYIV